MPLFDIDTLRSEFQAQTFGIHKKVFESFDETAARHLNEQTRNFSSAKEYDVFLCHSVKDAQAIARLVEILQKCSLRVYVDWIEDPQLDRSKVTPTTAGRIRDRLDSCTSLLMALSSNSIKSSWVQWELGLGDGKKNGKVAIIPLVRNNDQDKDFYKQEYLGLYPHIDHFMGSLYVNRIARGEHNFVNLLEWLILKKPLDRLIYS